MMQRMLRRYLPFLFIVLLTACGGGEDKDGGELPSANRPPTANAGVNQSVDAGAVVALSGTASDADGTVDFFAWSQISGIPVDISDANSARATFQAPEVSADTNLVFQLQVEDDDGATATDRVSVSVTVANVAVVELTLSVFGEGTVEIVGGADLECDVSHACRAFVPKDANVVLKALPMAGYAIDGWTGCNNVSDDECTVATDQDRLVAVNFLSTEPLELHDNVVAFDTDRVDQIEDFDIGTGVMVMSADADVSDLRIDAVIVSNVIDSNREFDTYFLRRIRDIQKLPGGVTYIRTVEATLEDAIASGSLSLSSSPRPLEVASYELPAGVTWTGSAPGSSPLVQQDGTSRRVEAAVDINLCLDPELCVMGSVGLIIEPDFAMDFSFFRGLKEFKMVVSVTPSAELTVTASAGVRGVYERDLPLKLTLTPIVLGPVVIIPELTPQLRVTASASAGFKPQVTVGFRMTGGAHYKQGSGWVPIGQYEPEFGFEIIGAGLEGNVQAAILAKFATKIYGIAGPFIEAGPYVGGAVFTLSPPRGGCDWDYAWYFGANANFGGELKFLWLGLEYTATLFDFRSIQGEHRNDCDDVDESPPRPPARLAFSDVSDNSLTLTWDESVDDSHHDVRYEIVRNPEMPSSKTFPDVGRSFLHDKGLRTSTEYCYQAVAIDGAGNRSTPSSLACTRTVSRDTEPPSKPYGVRLEALSPSTISVSWDASTDDDTAIDSYTVFEWPESKDAPTSITHTEALSADITGLNPGTEYCFGVTAVDEAGNFSDLSDMVCATTLQASAAAWRFLMACADRDYNFDEPLDLIEERAVSTVSVTGEGNDYDGHPLTYALTGTYTSQDMMLDGKIDWSFEGGGRRVDTFLADLSTGDTGDIPMELVFHSSDGCDGVIRFIMGRGMTKVAGQSSRAVSLSGATISGH